MGSACNIFFVYILRSQNNKLYIGQTNNLVNRQKYHDWGVASKFTHQNKGTYKLVYSEGFATRGKAMNRERQLKGWSRCKKEALIDGDMGLLKKL